MSEINRKIEEYKAQIEELKEKKFEIDYGLPEEKVKRIGEYILNERFEDEPSVLPFLLSNKKKPSVNTRLEDIDKELRELQYRVDELEKRNTMLIISVALLYITAIIVGLIMF